MATIDLDMPVRDLVHANPTIVSVMTDMGLSGVTDPSLLNTVGRFMTLRKGAKMKHIDLDNLVAQLVAAGFEVKQ